MPTNDIFIWIKDKHLVKAVIWLSPFDNTGTVAFYDEFDHLILKRKNLTKFQVNIIRQQIIDNIFKRGKKDAIYTK